MTALLDVVAPYVAALCRVSGLLISAPVIGSQSVPARIKVGLAIALSMLAAPLIATRISTEALPRLILPELIVGLVIGFSVQIIFEAVLMAGNLVGVQIGLSLVSILDPQTSADTPVVGIVHQMFATMIFLKLNGHLLLVQTLAKSFEWLPAGQLQLSASTVALFTHNVSAVWLIGMQLAAPILCVTLCMDVIAAFIGKASPQLPIMLIGASAKTLVGLAILGMTIALWPAALGDAFERAIATTNHLLAGR